MEPPTDIPPRPWILRVPTSRVSTLLALPLAAEPEPLAWISDDAVWVAASLEGARPASGWTRARAAGVRLFSWLVERLWVESSSLEVSQAPLAPPPAEAGSGLLLVDRRGGRGFSLPTLPAGDERSAWVPLTRALSLEIPEEAAAAPPAWPEARLEPTATAKTRAGAVGRRLAGSDLATRLRRVDARALGELRIGATRTHWWIVGPRGLAEEVPELGRPLRDIGTPLEPLLVPADRTPWPRASTAAWRERWEVADGEGLLWTDDDGGELVVRFRRSRLIRLVDVERLEPWFAPPAPEGEP